MICCYSLLFYFLLLPFLIIKMPMSYMDKMWVEDSAVRAAWATVFIMVAKMLAKVVMPACEKWGGAKKMAYYSVIIFAGAFGSALFVDRVWWKTQRKIESKIDRETLGARIPVA